MEFDPLSLLPDTACEERPSVMQLLASRAGNDAVRAIVDPGGDLTLTSYPSDAGHYRRTALHLAQAIEGYN